MKQKKTAVLLAMAMTAMSLTACSGKEEPSGEAHAPTEEKEDETEERDEEPETENTEDEEPEKEPEAFFKKGAEIEETVLYDENDIKITATDLSYTDYSAELNLVIENNGDEDLSFVTGSIGYSCCSINGYMIDDGYLNADIAAGKKSNESISFGTEALLLYGITEIADIQVGFQITDKDFDYSYVEPVQIKTSAADTYDYGTDTYRESISGGVWETASGGTLDYYAEEELYEENGVRIESEALMTNADGEQIVLLELLNGSDQIVRGCAGDLAINGLIVQGYDYSLDMVIPGTRRIMAISVSDLIDAACLEAFGIFEIGQFSCEFTLKDSENESITKPQEICITAVEGAKADEDGEALYDEKGIRIVSKGLVEASEIFEGDVHLLFLIENQSKKEVCINESYGSLSINGFMTDASNTIGLDLAPGKRAVLDLRISESALEENRITEIADITEAELTLEITDQKYNTLAEPTLKIGY